VLARLRDGGSARFVDHPYEGAAARLPLRNPAPRFRVPRRMTDATPAPDTPEALRAALKAADALINRLQELVADRLSRTGDIDEKEAFYQLVEALETAPEIVVVRMALGDDPHRFGDPTAVAATDHTG
jgi:hypothetical protein